LRLLLLADVHANLEALEAVLAAAGSCDRCFFLGDAVDYGPSPAACLQRLRQVAWVAIKGNHDAAVAEDFQCGWYGGITAAIRWHQQAALDPAALAFLAGLPLHYDLEAGGARFHLVHARPRSPLEGYLLPQTPDDVLRAETADVEADFLLLGHVHHQFCRRLGGVTVVNPGSVGQPRDGDPRAAFALWEDGEVSLQRVAYDVEAACRRLAELDLPPGDAETLAAILRQGS